MQSATHPTVAATLWPADSTNIVRNVILAVAGSLLLWLSAKISVPGPVPMTMQTFVVLGLGAAFGWRLASATVILYLIKGALHLPVFEGTPAKGIGLAYMAGPTGGYLVGFVFAAAAVGWLAERGADRNVFTMFLAMLAGTAIIYVPGLAWLSSLIGLEKAIQFGALPFLLGDAIKAALAAALFPAIWAILKKR